MGTAWRWRTSQIRRKSVLFPAATTSALSTLSRRAGRNRPGHRRRAGSVAGQRQGTHDGVHNFTVGQRKGLGLASPSPLYVIAIDRDSKQVTVGAEQELLRSFAAGAEVELDFDCRADGRDACTREDRHRHEPAWATLRPSAVDEVEVCFDEPVRAVTPDKPLFSMTAMRCWGRLDRLAACRTSERTAHGFCRG